MEQAEFAIWRFKNAEGVMDYVKTWNLTECVMDVKGKCVKLVYDVAAETVTISEPNSLFGKTTVVPFTDFVETMKKLGYYKPRDRKFRHYLSLPHEERDL